MQARKTIEYVPDPNQFDLVTHRWDTQGHLIAKNPYRKFINEQGTFYERPVGSGNLWLENNQPAGRVEYKINEKGHIYDKAFVVGAPHKQWTPPPTGAEMVTQQLEEAQAKLALAEAELRAIRKEHTARPEVKNFAPAAAETAATAKVPKLTKQE